MFKLSEGKKILIVGASGFGREVLTCLIDCIASTDHKIEEIACFMEKDDFYKTTKQVHNVPVIPDSAFNPEKYQVIIGVGEPHIRCKIVEKLPANTEYTTIIHPSAVISQWVEIGHGSIVTAGCILTTDIEIGNHAHLNLHTTIGHDCKIGDYFTTAPGANISGLCNFGNQVYIGTSAATRQAVTICDNVTVGMGSMVVKHIKEPGVYVGIPAKKIK